MVSRQSAILKVSVLQWQTSSSLHAAVNANCSSGVEWREMQETGGVTLRSDSSLIARQKTKLFANKSRQSEIFSKLT